MVSLPAKGTVGWVAHDRFHAVYAGEADAAASVCSLAHV